MLADELADRAARLARLAEAKAVREARARDRDALAQAEYAAKLRERAEQAQRRGGKPRGRAPQPPAAPGPRPTDQYNFTDPDSRIMKNAHNAGFEQAYNAQVAVEQASRFIVGHSLSNHPVDVREVAPTLDSIPPAVGVPDAAAMDTGYGSEDNVWEVESRGIRAHIATGRQAHGRDWQAYFAPEEPLPLAEDASLREQMAYRLRTAAGRAIYRLRKSTVEPVIGIIKEILGFRQFALRGLGKGAGEWCLVCLAYNLKRLHTVSVG